MFSLTSSSKCTPASWAASHASAALFFATNAAPLVALAIWIPARWAFWKRVNYFLFNICSIHFFKKILKMKMKKHEICFISLGPGLEWGAFSPCSEQYEPYCTTSVYSDLSTRYKGYRMVLPPHRLVDERAQLNITIPLSACLFLRCVWFVLFWLKRLWFVWNACGGSIVKPKALLLILY